ncbi:hypothetical protein [Bradyrhizobium canariense]|uniref:Uncharacterized protein n=1 Tax=Bradyrhizobium canariense TaxID=255045 RepID=A0A1H1VTV5_9BRAD|nr:hypothetical protein [Bradyrhizobium canariense]SDS88408.1 hypothetical protein SAMN05444158_3559 [Bradyrhizobium canariense]
MPAFSFEKIPPPVRLDPTPPITENKQRGVIVQILDRFVETRIKLTLRKDNGLMARRRQKPSD